MDVACVEVGEHEIILFWRFTLFPWSKEPCEAFLNTPCSCKEELARKTGSHCDCDYAFPLLQGPLRSCPLIYGQAVGSPGLKTSSGIRKENAIVAGPAF